MTPDELGYVFNRQLYNVCLAADAVRQSDERTHCASRSLAVVGGLIIARNLDDFLYPTSRNLSQNQRDKFPDDTYIVDFRLSWTPNAKAKLSRPDRQRINRISGHVVRANPGHFESSADVRRVILPLIDQGAEFIRQTVSEGKVSSAVCPKNTPTFTAWLNAGLRHLQIADVPEPS